jgi:hypothetical protein
MDNPVFGSNTREIVSIELISYVGHFSLANMMAMKIIKLGSIDSFLRHSINVDRQTHVQLHKSLSNNKIQQAWLQIDRTPRQALGSRTFRGVLFLSEQLTETVAKPSSLAPNSVTTFSFECHI